MVEKFKYMLAPLEDYTDSCFRSICKDVDMVFTELVSITALVKKNKISMERTKLYDETPTQIQILGQKEKDFEKFLETFEPGPGFKGFNLNLGCPSPSFVNQGLGCAMIKRTSKVKRIVEMFKAKGYPISIKMRLGLNEYEKKKKVYLNLINEVDADFFVVHARHGKETSSDKPDWSVFKECVETGKNIIANGGIKTKRDVENLSFCQGVMIGKIAVNDPLIFSKLKGLPIASVEDLFDEYETLAEERGINPRYKKNIYKRQND